MGDFGIVKNSFVRVKKLFVEGFVKGRLAFVTLEIQEQAEKARTALSAGSYLIF